MNCFYMMALAHKIGQHLSYFEEMRKELALAFDFDCCYLGHQSQFEMIEEMSKWEEDRPRIGGNEALKIMDFYQLN
jgi:hypothetical protein